MKEDGALYESVTQVDPERSAVMHVLDPCAERNNITAYCSASKHPAPVL